VGAVGKEILSLQNILEILLGSTNTVFRFEDGIMKANKKYNKGERT